MERVVREGLGAPLVEVVEELLLQELDGLAGRIFAAGLHKGQGNEDLAHQRKLQSTSELRQEVTKSLAEPQRGNLYAGNQ